MNTEEDEFNRIEREASMRKEAVRSTVTQRPWVGLTNEELDFYERELGLGELGRGVIRAAVDLLKEKNQ